MACPHHPPVLLVLLRGGGGYLPEHCAVWEGGYVSCPHREEEVPTMNLNYQDEGGPQDGSSWFVQGAASYQQSLLDYVITPPRCYF